MPDNWTVRTGTRQAAWRQTVLAQLMLLPSVSGLTTSSLVICLSVPASGFCTVQSQNLRGTNRTRAATSSKTQAFPAVLNWPNVASDLSDCLRVLRWPLRGRQPGVASKRYASALRGFRGSPGLLERVV